MRILVTGGAGFIGHNVVRMLEQQGHECWIIDTQTNYGFIPKDELDYLIPQRLQRIKSKVKVIDIRDTKHVETILKVYKIDTVVHLASFPRQKIVNTNPVLASDVMNTGLLNLLELCKKQENFRTFIYVSSSMVYGDFANNVDESADCNPIGAYGIMKLMGEHLVADYARQGYFDHIIIRPSAVYGEYDIEDRVISKFLTSALRGDVLKVHGPTEVLDFTHVDDLALGIAQAVDSESAVGVYNLTRSAAPVPLQDVANMVINIVGKGFVEIADRDSEYPSRGTLNISRARDHFNYDPKINIQEGLTRYHAWLSQNPVLWRR